MRTGMYFTAATVAVLGTVEAASLKAFPAHDLELAEIADDSTWSVDDFAQYDFTPVPMDDAYFAEIETITHAISETTAGASMFDPTKITKMISAATAKAGEKAKGTGQMVMNIGVALGAAADAATGGTTGALLNAIKNSGDIMLVLNKKPSEITLDDAATIANQVPVLNDIVKSISKVKALSDRYAKGDTVACYRRNWEISPKSKCRAGRSKWLGVLCMDDCPKNFKVCNVFGIMCATEDYCNYFKEEAVADLISTGVTVAVVAGTGGGLGILTLFQNVLTLTEKFGHPRCGEDHGTFKKMRDAALAKFKPK